VVLRLLFRVVRELDRALTPRKRPPTRRGGHSTGEDQAPSDRSGHQARPRPGPYSTPQLPRTLKGRAWVIDGDTIVIDQIHIRLWGIDAPELNHPWGKKSRSAMIGLCMGQVVRAEIEPPTTYDRVVAKCYLADGRDLSAELVKIGLAIDWAKYSGGIYRHLEPEGIRKKLWRADAKQKGRYDERRHG